VSGAAPLAGEVLKKFEEKLQVPLIEGYGLSEASPVVSVNPLDGVRKAGSVGPPVPAVEARIADEKGGVLKTGEIGEIVVRGPNIMKGYFNREMETNEILKDGWLYTGDIGRMDEDGYIYILDRKKDLIIVNGMNLYPREVEEILYKHPSVQDAAVVGIKDAVHGEVPVGVVQLKEGMSATDQELRKFCKPHLGNYKVPHRFEFWKELPRTGTGKVLKREIKRIISEKKQ
jgi:long-chain acyl-CoA synthetase